MSLKDDYYQKARGAIERAKQDPQVQATLKQFQEETKKYAPQAKQIEEIQILQGVFDAAYDEAVRLQKEFDSTPE